MIPRGQIGLRSIQARLTRYPVRSREKRRSGNWVIKSINAHHVSYESGLVISQSVQTGEWALLSAYVPGRPPEPVGILLRDQTDGLHVKLRTDWSGFIVDEDEIEIWSVMGQDLQQKGEEIGGAWLLDWLEDTASHVLQIGARERVEVSDAQTIVGELYRRHVEFKKVVRNAK
jgi:hypothetical protein